MGYILDNIMELVSFVGVIREEKVCLKIRLLKYLEMKSYDSVTYFQMAQKK